MGKELEQGLRPLLVLLAVAVAIPVLIQQLVAVLPWLAPVLLVLIVRRWVSGPKRL